MFIMFTAFLCNICNVCVTIHIPMLGSLRNKNLKLEKKLETCKKYSDINKIVSVILVNKFNV